jgi:hypothetical protein
LLNVPVLDSFWLDIDQKPIPFVTFRPPSAANS